MRGANGHKGRTGRFSLMSSEQRRKPPTLPRVEFMERTAWVEDESLLAPSGAHGAPGAAIPGPAMRRPLKVEDED